MQTQKKAIVSPYDWYKLIDAQARSFGEMNFAYPMPQCSKLVDKDNGPAKTSGSSYLITWSLQGHHIRHVDCA